MPVVQHPMSRDCGLGVIVDYPTGPLPIRPTIVAVHVANGLNREFAMGELGKGESQVDEVGLRMHRRHFVADRDNQCWVRVILNAQAASVDAIVWS
jgi:hypothetical protein